MDVFLEAPTNPNKLDTEEKRKFEFFSPQRGRRGPDHRRGVVSGRVEERGGGTEGAERGQGGVAHRAEAPWRKEIDCRKEGSGTEREINLRKEYNAGCEFCGYVKAHFVRASGFPGKTGFDSNGKNIYVSSFEFSLLAGPRHVLEARGLKTRFLLLLLSCEQYRNYLALGGASTTSLSRAVGLHHMVGKE